MRWVARRAVVLYHPPRCSNGPRCPRGRASSAPGCPGAVRSPSPRTSWPVRAWRRAAEAGVAHFMEHLTFKGTAATRRPGRSREAIEGVGGSFNAATDRESTVYWVRVPRREAARAMDVLGELIVRPDARRRRRSTASGRSSSRRSARTSTTRPSTPRSCSSRRCSATGRWAARSAATRTGIRALPDRRRSATSGGRCTGRRTRSSRSPATSTTTRRVELAAAAFGTGNGVVPGLRAGAGAARRRARPRSAARHGPGPAHRRRARRSARDHPDAWTLAVLNAVLGDGMSSRLFLSVREAQGLAYDVSLRARRLRRRRRARDLGRRRPGAAAGGARRDPGASSPGCATSPSRPRSWRRPRRYLAGGLELRMDETRHLASWIGGQEALHDRVLTLDEALAAVAAVTPATIQRLAGELFRDEGLRLAVVAPARHLRGLETHLRLPAMTARRPTAIGRRRGSPSTVRPRRALRTLRARPRPPAARARSASPAPSSRRSPAATRSTTTAILDLAEARWRTGDLAGAGEAAAAVARGRPDDIARARHRGRGEAALGRPGEARRLAGQAMERADGSLDPCSRACRGARSGRPSRTRGRPAGPSPAPTTSAARAGRDADAGSARRGRARSGDATARPRCAWASRSALGPGFAQAG